MAHAELLRMTATWLRRSPTRAKVVKTQSATRSRTRTWTRWVGSNQGLRVNVARGLPVRVIRGPPGDPHFSPPSDYRTLASTLSSTAFESQDGPRICQVKLVKTDGWTVPTSTEVPERRPAPRVPAKTMRVVRVTDLANAVKYTCHVCGLRPVRPNGGVYADGAALFLQYYGDCFPDDVTLGHLSVNVIDTYLQEQLR